MAVDSDAKQDRWLNPSRNPLFGFITASATWIGIAFFNSWRLRHPVDPGGRAPNHISFWLQQNDSPVLHASAFLAGCALVILVGRARPNYRDWLNALLGMGFCIYLAGPQFTGLWLALACAVYVIAPRIAGYLGMVACAAVVLLFFTYVRAERSELAFGWTALRLVSFVFEVKAARRRSLISFLAFAPFGILMLTGEPPMVSYVTYNTKRKQSELDALGAGQLLRTSAKTVLFITLLALSRMWVTSLDEFLALPVWARLLAMPLGTVLVYLALSAACDFNTGMSNLAGYYAPSAFEAPFLADTPFEFWRRWNTHVMAFLRTSCIYPLSKKKVPIGIVVFLAMTASGVLHCYVESIESGMEMWQRARDNILAQAIFPFLGVFLLATIPWEKRRPKLKWPGILITQAVHCALLFNAGLAFVAGESLDMIGQLRFLRGLLP